MRTPIYQVNIDGQDVSTTLSPILISLSLRFGDQDEADTLTLELDDTGGQIALPSEGAPVTAALFWDDDGRSVEFEGFLDGAHSGSSDEGHGHHHHASHHGHKAGASGTLRSSGSRSGGRVLTVTAKSADMSSTLKERTHAHKDNATFGDVAREWGQNAGLSDVKVADSLAGVQRAWWGILGESYLTWGTRTAIEIGATFKVLGTVGVFVPRTGGMSFDGQALTPVAATWGVNLISWEISPVLSRPSYGGVEASYYDPQQAGVLTEQAEGSATSSKATHRHMRRAPTKDQAKRQANADKGEIDREKGVGSVTIDGEPAAQAGAICTVAGIRPGVDGSYVISQGTHTFNRSSGWTTQLELKQPTGAAGTDTRTDTNQATTPPAL